MGAAFGGGSIELTPDHVILLDGNYAPAREARLGSRLSLGATVTRVGQGQDGIVNPITTSGTILAAGATGAPMHATIFGEWIATFMLGASVYPLPVSLSSTLSFLFPAHVQSYYDEWLEAGNAGRGTIDAAMRAVPVAVMPVVAAAADLFFAAGLGVFALCSLKLALLLGALVALAANSAAKA